MVNPPLQKHPLLRVVQLEVQDFWKPAWQQEPDNGPEEADHLSALAHCQCDSRAHRHVLELLGGDDDAESDVDDAMAEHVFE